jgi:hypothetical protein
MLGPYEQVLYPFATVITQVNCMITSMAAYDAVQKIRFHTQLNETGLQLRQHRGSSGRHYPSNLMFDLSEFDRLAAHRRLRSFEVRVSIEKGTPALKPENLE